MTNNPADVQDIAERLRRKARTMPQMGGGFISETPTSAQTIKAGSYISDDGMRLVNPDGPEAAAEIERLRAALQHSREAVTKECADVAEWNSYYPQEGEDIAKAIRALSQESAD